MTFSTLKIAITPKRMLTQSEAAHHCGRPVKRFAVECPVAPVVFPNGDRRFDVRDLDGWIDSFKVDAVGTADDILARL